MAFQSRFLKGSDITHLERTLICRGKAVDCAYHSLIVNITGFRRHIIFGKVFVRERRVAKSSHRKFPGKCADRLLHDPGRLCKITGRQTLMHLFHNGAPELLGDSCFLTNQIRVLIIPGPGCAGIIIRVSAEPDVVFI